MRAIIATGAPDGKEVQRRLWYASQNFLIAVANISKLIWRKDGARSQLRGVLAVEAFAALKERKFRNHFEHYDERLERWLSSSESRTLVDSNFGRIEDIPGVEPSDYHRNYDPVSHMLTFQGDQYDVPKIMDVVRKLHDNVIDELKKDHPQTQHQV